MLTESRLALTVLAGRTVVDAASTDGWDTVRCGYARLLGRGDTERTRLAEQRLDETRKQLIDVARTEVWLYLSSELALRWTERLADLLAENPDAEADLRTLIQEIQTTLPSGALSGSSQTAFVGGGENIDRADEEVIRVLNADVTPPGQDGREPGDQDLPVPSRVHPETLATKADRASRSVQAGDAVAARDELAALLPAAEQVLGPEHPDALATRSELAYWTGRAGDVSAAREELAALLPA